MTRLGALRRSAVAGLALASATSLVCAATGGAAMAAPSDPSALSRALQAGPRAEVRDAGGGAVPDRYIVVLADRKATPTEVRATASALADETGGTVRRIFTNALRGYSATMTKRQAQRLAADPDVAYVQPVQRYSATDTQTSPPSWGLDRIDQAPTKLNGSYTYPGTGAGVTAYVLDTGIDINHQDFGGRASHGYDAVEQDAVAQDCNGHGTHVAGTVGGTTYGVAKGVNLVGVRVLDCEGAGTSEQIIAGIDWVTANAVKPAVANMSLGFFGIDQAVTDAVNRSIASGVTYAVAAGNASSPACDVTPAAVPAAITVGATDRWDFRAWFSNQGPCVDIFAPGVNIVSAAAGTTSGSVDMTGTSMASPHVAGAAALLLQAHPEWTPQQVRDDIVTSGIAGPVHDEWDTMDRLLHVGAVQPARSSYGLKARVNGRYVTAESGGTKPLIARGTTLGAWEKYDVVDAGSGLVGLRAKINGKFVTAESAGANPLIARASSIGAWEKFQIINNTDGTVSLKAAVNGRYVTAPSTTLPLIASKTTIGTAEKFDFDAPPPVVSITSRANGRFVTAESAGTLPLIARATSVGAWERFELVPGRTTGYFALRALVNGKYVTAESTGTKPLIARASSIGVWEKFAVFDYNSDGSIYIAAYVDGEIVTAGSTGTSQLIASRTIDWNSPTYGFGNGEKFTINLL